jgi:TnpA family transposase
MTSIHETAYPRLKPDPSAKDLIEIYTPTAEEIAFVATLSRRPAGRIAALLHLKLFQRLGCFIHLDNVPIPIRDHVVGCAGLGRCPSLTALKRFERSGSRHAVVTALRRYLNVRVLDAHGQAWMVHVAETAAQTRQVVADIINVMLEELVHHRYELPAFSRLERIAIEAREKTNSAHYEHLAGQLSTETRRLIDSLLKTQPGNTTSGWHRLKREPKRPTNKETRGYLQHIRFLKDLVEQLPKPEIPIPKLKQYRLLARSLDAAEMADLTKAKRYALAIIFIRAQHAQALDDVADLFVRLVQNLENRARKYLLEHQLDHVLRTDRLVEQLRDVLTAYRIEGTDTQKLEAIDTSLSANVDELVAECDEHLAYAGRNYYPFLLKPYRAVRAQLLNCIELVSPQSTSEDQVTVRLIEALGTLRSVRQETVTLGQLGLDEERDLGWISQPWRRHIIVKTHGEDAPTVVDRRYFELAAILQVKAELKSGDLYIQHGERYDDYREQLIDDETLARELEEYGAVTGIEVMPANFVRALRQEMLQVAEQIDANFPENAHAQIVDGRLILKRPAPPEVLAAVRKLDAQINERMAPASIVDVLIDAERWLDLNKLFRPLAGTDSRLEDLRMRVITTLFCFGCNLGPTQTAKSIKGLSRRRIAWLNLKYVSEEVLEQAIVKVINAYNRFALPGFWGTGKHASADGTKWDLYEQNLVSEHHIRYGGYGGIGYYHVSDKLIALFSHFLSCGTYEGIYILDGLMKNTSDIQPDTLHGDTQAQSYPVFALSHLLGIKLMPRIRGIKELVFHRPEAGMVFQNTNALYGEPINWNLIEVHLPDMLRVAISIKLGRISPSAILRRLGTYSRKNRLYFAFRELGKVVRTIFLLRYIGDAELRQVIQAETNKSEQFNGFAKWSFFGGEGVIAENIRHEQRKIVKYNHLVANMVILHNVAAMTEVLAELAGEGTQITPEVLAALGPFRTAHINRFGDYTLDLRRKVEPMNFDRKII